MEEPKATMTVETSEVFSLPMVENLKQEKLEPPLSNMYSENIITYRDNVLQSTKEKTKRPYNKKPKTTDFGNVEKPPPKKRGRKSKKELMMMNKKSEYAQEFQPTYKSPKVKSPSQPKSQKTRKASATKVKKATGSAPGPSVFDKKLLAGPHLTMKQVLEYILTDHSYCVPPDPLPAVGSNHQMIRHILGPKDAFKARSAPNVGSMESGERSPISYSRTRTQLSMSSTPPPSSKLENLLKRGESSPMGGSTLRFSHSRIALDCEPDVDIDVVGEDQEPEKKVVYDVNKAKEVMNECEKYVEFARNVDTGDNWESKIVRTGWTKQQSGLFDKVIGVLHTERLARLTYMSAGDAEPVLRRTSLDRTACRIRRIFGEYLWDTKLTQWLHSVLTEFLNFGYLAIYMDVLQSLKSQCPQLVSRMMKLSIILPLQSAYSRSSELQELLTPYLEEETSNLVQDECQWDNERARHETSIEKAIGERLSQDFHEGTEIYLPAKSVVPQVEDAMMQLHSAKNAEAFKILLERQWDPFSSDLLQRLKKLSANPIFLVIAPGAIFEKSSLNRRLKLYYRMFNRVGKVVKVRPSIRETLECVSPFSYMEEMASLAKEKLKDVRLCFPDRPLYLVGWGCGSILAARLSVTVGPVDGIIALGFPLHSIKELYEDSMKFFGGIKHPTLFVIGGQSSNNSLTDMELFRRRLSCETSLVVVGSGNENLYVSRDHREKLLVTQSYVDKTVMDEIAYFVNLHSKHNQIIAANISMKPHQFTKSQSNPDVINSKKSNLLRTKKRKASCAELDADMFVTNNNEDSKDSYDSEMEKCQETSNTRSSLQSSRKDIELNKPALGTYDYGYDGPKFIPSNKSSNKRKNYYRPDTSTSSSISSPSCITASKLLQQSPNAKRRMSKPSGPTHHRVPMLNQQPTQRRNSSGGQMTDIPKDDPAGLFKYLSTTTPNTDQDLSQSNGSNFPLVGQNEGQFQGGTGTMSKEAAYDKSSRKKTSSKSKGPKHPKTTANESPTSSIVSALSEVMPSNKLSNPVPPSSLDMHKYVIQHKQMLRQFEQTQDRSQSSQLFKLLSPGLESSDTISVASLSSTGASASGSQGTSDLIKLKLIGTQTLVQSEIPSEGRTAVISKQNLLSNMSLPMIRLTRPATTEDNSQQQVYVTGPSTSGSSILPNLSSDSSEKILLRTSDQSVMKINATELKSLLAGRQIQLITGVPNQGAVNIIVKKPPEVVENASTIVKGNEEPVASLPIAHPFPTASMTDTSKPSDSPEISKETTVAQTSNESKVGDSSTAQPGEPESTDVDMEEEMSGLLISSTFSMCPTSGERVLPPVPSSDGSERVSRVEETESSNSSTMNMVTSNEELLSVPIHVKVSNTIQQGTNLSSAAHDVINDPTLLTEATSKADDQETQEIQTDQAATSGVQDGSSATVLPTSEPKDKLSPKTDAVTPLSVHLEETSKPNDLAMNLTNNDVAKSDDSSTKITGESSTTESPHTITSDTNPSADDTPTLKCSTTSNDIVTTITEASKEPKESLSQQSNENTDKKEYVKETALVTNEISTSEVQNVPGPETSAGTDEVQKEAENTDVIEPASVSEYNTIEVQRSNETPVSETSAITTTTTAHEVNLAELQSSEKSENSEGKSCISSALKETALVINEIGTAEVQNVQEPKTSAGTDEVQNAPEPKTSAGTEEVQNAPEPKTSASTDEVQKEAEKTEPSRVSEDNTIELRSSNETPVSERSAIITTAHEVNLTELQSTEKSDNFEKKSSISSANSDEDKRKSKSNPVRRSARLKSGV